MGYRLIPHPTPAIDRKTATLPLLAVQPFAALTTNSPDYFADGVVEDIITALSRFTSFAVIARDSSFAYRDKTIDARQAARDLGVRYVL